jgi:hypothetical protein
MAEKSTHRPVRRRVAVVTTSLCLAALAVAFVRLRALDYDLTFMVPQKVHDVEVVQVVEGHGEAVKLSTFLPLSDERQRVLRESNSSGAFELAPAMEGGNRVARWRAEDVQGEQVITYSYRVAGQALRFDISPAFRLGGRPERGVPEDTLEPTDTIQSDAPEIVDLAESLVPADRSLLGFLRAAFDHVQAFGYKPFKGTTDALTALRLQEASCNGRSRLLVALLRAQGVPARLVGGLILEDGRKRTSHQWIEARVGARWIPFDPLNQHFAEIPDDYLVLYRGDEVLFTHTADVGYRYHFAIDADLVPRQELQEQREILGLWAVFTELGIPLELLQILIMIPLGATVVVIFRNVVGLRVFGTFLPVLIAAAAHNTGYAWGALAFCGLIVLVSGVRRLLGRLELLHSPQLAVLLTVVIGALLLIALLSARFGLNDLARVSLFPVAILAITSERFLLVEIEEGARAAWTTMARTLLVMFFCYVTMNSLSLQILMLGFPELLLVIVALDIWLGRWVGLRLTEWARFQALWRAEGAKP